MPLGNSNPRIFGIDRGTITKIANDTQAISIGTYRFHNMNTNT